MRYLMFFVKPSRNYYYSDPTSLQVSNFYMPISNLSLTIANRSNTFSSCPQEHLFALAIESGEKVKWNQFRGYGSGMLPTGQTITPPVFGSAQTAVQGLGTSATPSLPAINMQYEPLSGAPLLLDMSVCGGYSEELTIGRPVPISITASVNVANTSGLQVNQLEFFILAISPSYLQIDHMNGNSLVVLGGVSNEESMQLASMDLGSIDNVHQTKFAGGFSFSDVVSKVKGLLPGVKNVAKAVASGLESMGYGTGAGVTGAAMHGEAMNNKKMAAVMKKMKMMSM